MFLATAIRRCVCAALCHEPAFYHSVFKPVHHIYNQPTRIKLRFLILCIFSMKTELVKNNLILEVGKSRFCFYF